MKKIKKILCYVVCLAMLLSIAPSSLSTDAATKSVAKTSITKIESKAKGFKVSWKKKSKIKGYQIQYSTSSKFKNSKTKTISKSSTKSITITKLKGCNKKYYVRIRTYKISKGKKVYSSWSKTKKVKTLDHKYSKATCKKAKTCKYCKKAKGKTADHSINSKGKCKWCKKVLAVSPSKLKKRTYKLIKPIKIPLEKEVDGVSVSKIDFSKMGITTGLEYVISDYYDGGSDSVSYKGDKYYLLQGGMGNFLTKKTSKNYITITTADGLNMKLQLLSNDTLKVVSIKGDKSWKKYISIGDIFK